MIMLQSRNVPDGRGNCRISAYQSAFGVHFLPNMRPLKGVRHASQVIRLVECLKSYKCLHRHLKHVGLILGVPSSTGAM